MKKIVCELCEGTEFTKENGMFVCHGCGTRYTPEEARSMMREVEGEAPAVTRAPAAAVPAGNPNQAQLDNILVLATTAYEAQNYAEAENYCNQAVVLDAMCYKAWNLKAKAVGWQSKIDNLRIEEAAHSFCKAIDFAPEEEKENLKNQASEELKKLGLALISLRKDRFSGSPDKKELNGFTNDKKVLLNSLLVLLSHGNFVGIPEGYLDQVATMMNEAAVAAFKMAQNAWRKVEHPSDKDLSTYIDWIANIESLLRQAIDTSDDDDEADIQRYKNLAVVLEEPIGKHSDKRYWDSFWNEYRWTSSQALTSAAVATRRQQAQEARNKAVELEAKVAAKKAEAARKAEEERLAQIAAYWEAHADEKAALDAERAELVEKAGALTAERDNLNAAIAAAQPTAPVPSEQEANGYKNQIGELMNRRSKLGLFAGKEKKQIDADIAVLQGKVDALQTRIALENQARRAEIDEKTAPMLTKLNEVSAQLGTTWQRVSEIDQTLSKIPEE